MATKFNSQIIYNKLIGLIYNCGATTKLRCRKVCKENNKKRISIYEK